MIDSHKISFILFLILIFTFWFSLALFPVQNFDIWYHLATGRYIFQHHAIPRTDIFSCTASGVPWITHEWACQLKFYLLFRFIGINGLIIVKSLVFALTGTILFFTGTRLNCPASVSALITGIVGGAISFRAFLRPHITTWFFLAVTGLLLYGYPDKLRRIGIFILPPVFLYWSNFHSGFVFGLIWLGVVLAFRIFNRNPDHIPLRTGLLLFGSCFTAALLNFNTYHALIYPLKFWSEPLYFKYVSELRPLLTPGFEQADFFKFFLVLSILALILILLNFKRLYWEDGFIFVAFLFLAFKSVRNVPIAALMITPGLFRNIGFTLSRSERPRSGETFGSILKYIAPILITVGIFHTLYFGINLGPDGIRRPGLGVSAGKMPRNALDFLRKHGIRGNMFNTFAFGSYLIWAGYPDYKVFIDGRLFLYPQRVRADYRSILMGSRDYTDLLAKYNITYIILSYPQGRTIPGIYRKLKSSKQWMLTYWDDTSLVYLKATPENTPVIEEWKTIAINPLERKLADIDARIRLNMSQVISEAKKVLSFNPDNAGALIYLGRADALSGKWKTATGYFKRAIHIIPDRAIYHQLLAECLVRSGKPAYGEKEFEIACGLRPDDYAIPLHAGVLFHNLGKRDKAKNWYLRALKQAPDNFDVNKDLGIVAAEKHQFDVAKKYWEKALSVRPGSAGVIRNLERIRQLQTTGTK